MELEEFIDMVKDKREELAHIMCDNKNYLNYEKTLDSLNYLSLPLLLLLDKECLEHQRKLEE